MVVQNDYFVHLFFTIELSLVCLIVLRILNLNQIGKSLEEKCQIVIVICNYKEVTINTCDKKSISCISEITSSIVNDDLS
jgi:cell division protein FtsX